MGAPGKMLTHEEKPKFRSGNGEMTAKAVSLLLPRVYVSKQGVVYGKYIPIMLIFVYKMSIVSRVPFYVSHFFL